MQKQCDRLTNIMDGKLGQIKLGDKCKGEASGPQLVPAVDEEGRPGFTTGWQLTVWLEHDKLLGQDALGYSVPVPMLLPPAELVERITTQLLESARENAKLARELSAPDRLQRHDDVEARGAVARLPAGRDRRDRAVLRRRVRGVPTRRL